MKAPPSRSEAELQEEEELQLAIALSQSEAESKKTNKRSSGGSFGSVNKPSGTSNFSAPMTMSSQPVMDTSDMDPELARYLDRNYWSQKATDDGKPSIGAQLAAMQPSAPVANTEQPKAATVSEKYQNGEVGEEQQFLNALRSSIEIFVNRMKSNSTRGRSIANDSSVQTLFLTLNTMHPQLLKYVNQQDESRAHYEGLQDKLAQLRDAREALDALREEHRAKKQREMEELERQRQIQLQQKLELLRIEKVKYLETQRQMMLQRMQEQEHQMSLHLEKQKQMQQMRSMQQVPGYGYQQPPPYGYPQSFSPPPGSLEGSPHHQGVPPQGYLMQQPGMPPYSQAGYAGGPGMTQQGFPQGGYSMPGNYQPTGPAGQPLGPGTPGGNQQGQNVQSGFSMQPQQPDYNAYSMQGMANALPGGAAPPGGPAAVTQPYMPGPGAQQGAQKSSPTSSAESVPSYAV